MTNPTFARALGLLCVLAASPFAAIAQATPDFSLSSSPSPTAAPAKKSDPSGLGMMQKDRPKGAKTEITSQTEATFDNASSIATFVGTVFVKDPQFNLYCDKLTVYLRKDRKGIDHAEADGHVVIVQDNTNDRGEAVKSIGRSGHAVFDPATGDVTLTIMPQLQQGINNHISTDAKTVMILNRAGRLKTIGGSRTILVDAAQAGGAN